MEEENEENLWFKFVSGIDQQPGNLTLSEGASYCGQTESSRITGDPSSLYEPHNEHNMASNYKGLYGIFYKISMKVIKSENVQ